MAQHDYVIDNQSSANFRADLNNALAAIVSVNSGTTAPASTFANMLWYETDTNILWKRNEANSAWISLGTVDETNSKFEPNQSIATQAEAEGKSENTKLMTSLRVSQQRAKDRATSTDYAITLGGLITFAHGLSSTPSIIQPYLVCQTAQAGYSVGDIVQMPLNMTTANNTRLSSIYTDSTNVYLRIATSLVLADKGTTTATGLTAANWKIRLKALV